MTWLKTLVNYRVLQISVKGEAFLESVAGQERDRFMLGSVTSLDPFGN
ncbi:MAG: hypothetical protein AAF268_02120 [Cyanobacteria bacterium P01_A01_bin.3]